MTSSLLYLIFLGVLPISSADYGTQFKFAKLSSLENSRLQKTCGLDGHYHTKVLNNDVPQDSPWAAAVNVKGILTASVISSRHILLFNTFQWNQEMLRFSLFNDTYLAGAGECVFDEDWIIPEEAKFRFSVKFANEQFGTSEKYKVSRIAVIGACTSYDQCDTYKPMILELESDLKFDKNHGPVCLPRKDDNLVNHSDFIVYGLGPKGESLSSAQFTRKECDQAHDQNHVFCGKATNESRVLCSGDFGGGAITNSNGRSVIMGVYAEGNIRCDAVQEPRQEPEFIDISAYTDSICRQTGICPDQVEELSTSTDGPYLSGQETEETEESYEPESTTESSITTTLETIVAETFEKMKLSNCTAHEAQEIHIHIHLDKNMKLSNN